MQKVVSVGRTSHRLIEEMHREHTAADAAVMESLRSLRADVRALQTSVAELSSRLAIHQQTPSIDRPSVVRPATINVAVQTDPDATTVRAVAGSIFPEPASSSLALRPMGLDERPAPRRSTSAPRAEPQENGPTSQDRQVSLEGRPSATAALSGLSIELLAAAATGIDPHVALDGWKRMQQSSPEEPQSAVHAPLQVDAQAVYFAPVT